MKNSNFYNDTFDNTIQEQISRDEYSRIFFEHYIYNSQTLFFKSGQSFWSVKDSDAIEIG